MIFINKINASVIARWKTVFFFLIIKQNFEILHSHTYKYFVVAYFFIYFYCDLRGIVYNFKLLQIDREVTAYTITSSPKGMKRLRTGSGKNTMVNLPVFQFYKCFSSRYGLADQLYYNMLIDF